MDVEAKSERVFQDAQNHLRRMEIRVVEARQDRAEEFQRIQRAYNVTAKDGINAKTGEIMRGVVATAAAP